MKTHILHFWVLLFMFGLSPNTYACDICGCGPGGSFTGILPQFQRNFIGLRYQYRQFNHPNTELNKNGNSRVYSDVFHRSEIWGRYNPHPRIQMFAFVPFHYNIRNESMRTTEKQSIGDIQLMANYMLINTGDSVDTQWKNTLMGGARIKLPTGKYQMRDETKLLLPLAFQPGNGAYGYTFNLIYTTRINKWGMNTDFFYTINTKNELEYQMGNAIQSSLSLFYVHTTPRGMLLSSLGLAYENMKKDLDFGTVKPYTGGTYVLLNAGLDFYMNRFIVNVFAQQPVYAKIPSHQALSSIRFGAGIVITL